MRSDDAIAPCSTLNFSDMSLIGRKKRCEYCRKATSEPERQRVGHDAAAAVPDDQRRRERAHQLDGRIEHRVVEDRLDVRVAVRPVDVVEGCEVARFAPEQLHRGRARDPFLQVGVDPGDPHADSAVRVANVPPEPLRDQRDQRQHRKRDQRQPPVHPDQHRHDADAA